MKLVRSPRITKRDSKTVGRFWKKVVKLSVGRCWVWTGAKSEHGYGRFRFKRKTWVAPRLAWIISNGPVPTGKLVLHKCDNPACVNPNHLFIGTQTDNMRDAIKKGRWTPEHKWKLTQAKVTRIRKLYQTTDITQQQLADMNNVGSGAIHSVISRKTWRKRWPSKVRGRRILKCLTR